MISELLLPLLTILSDHVICDINIELQQMLYLRFQIELREKLKTSQFSSRVKMFPIENAHLARGG